MKNEEKRYNYSSVFTDEIHPECIQFVKKRHTECSLPFFKTLKWYQIEHRYNFYRITNEMDKTVLFSIGQEKIDPINYDVIMDLPKKDTLKSFW